MSQVCPVPYVPRVPPGADIIYDTLDRYRTCSAPQFTELRARNSCAWCHPRIPLTNPNLVHDSMLVGEWVFQLRRPTTWTKIGAIRYVDHYQTCPKPRFSEHHIRSQTPQTSQLPRSRRRGRRLPVRVRSFRPSHVITAGLSTRRRPSGMQSSRSSCSCIAKRSWRARRRTQVVLQASRALRRSWRGGYSSPRAGA